MKITDRCYGCEFENKCKFAHFYEFCEDCADYKNCTIRFDCCKAGHEIECNNGFEPKYEWEDYDTGVEND